MAAHTKNDLYQMQSLPLDEKIRMTARRIDAFIDRNDAYLSISGGKDSRVLDDIERRFVRAKLPRVFIDTGLEHRSVRACGKKHADIILRPEKNFKQIITEYGYPVISKEVAQTIAEARKGLKNGNCYTYRMAKLNGTAVDKNGDKSKYNIPQYKFLLDAPFRISHKCCDYMKKKPAKQYEKETGRLPIVATMAEESNLRLQKWLKHGCNAFDLKRPMSAPMSFWSENDVLEYLFKYELDYAECYGKIIPKIYDFLLYIYPLLAKYPKFEKFSLQTATRNAILEMLQEVIKWDKTATKSHLYTVDTALQESKELLRLAHDLEYSAMNARHYGESCRKLKEIGVMLGELIEEVKARK